MAHDETVRIFRLDDDPSKCRVEPNPCETKPGGTLTFKFMFDTPDGHVVFVGPSPLKDDPATPGKFKQNHAHEVQDIKQRTRFAFKVLWGSGGGSGDGQGDVVPG